MGKVYAASDWHGMYDIGKSILDRLGPDDTLYYLGDAIDRGSRGYELLMLLLNDPRVIFLKGNHEEFFEEYVPSIVAYENGECDYKNADLWICYNGGNMTYKNMFAHATFEELLATVAKIKQLPLHIDYTNKQGKILHLSHSGYTPDAFRDRHKGPDYLWDRDHLRDTWPPDHENEYIIHGHTPVHYLMKRKWMNDEEIEAIVPEVQIYADGHKYDIDLGSFFSYRAALLDLDSFEIKYFDGRVADATP